MRIASADAITSLSFERVGSMIRASLHGRDVVASTDVFIHPGDPQTIPSFFRSLARDWMDAPEALAFTSPDGALALSCDWDPRGHFHLRVDLRRVGEWSLTAALELEVGLLDAIANEIEATL